MLRDFSTEAGTLDWTTIFEHETAQEALHDALTSIMYHTAITEGLDQAERLALLGELTFRQAQLANALTFGDEQRFVSEGKALETLLKKLITSGQWLSLADKRFEQMEALQAKLEDGSVSAKEAHAITPVMLMLELIRLLNADQEDECCQDEE